MMARPSWRRFRKGAARLVGGDVERGEFRGNLERRIRQVTPGRAVDDFAVGVTRLTGLGSGIGAPVTTTERVMARRNAERNAILYQLNHPGTSVTVSGGGPATTPTAREAAAATRETILDTTGDVIGGTLGFVGDLGAEILDEAGDGISKALSDWLSTPLGLAAAGTAAYFFLVK